MSFFKEFKADLSQAVNEMMSEEEGILPVTGEAGMEGENMMVDTIVEDEEEEAGPSVTPQAAAVPVMQERPAMQDASAAQETPVMPDIAKMLDKLDMTPAASMDMAPAQEVVMPAQTMDAAPAASPAVDMTADAVTDHIVSEAPASEAVMMNDVNMKNIEEELSDMPVQEENTMETIMPEAVQPAEEMMENQGADMMDALFSGSLDSAVESADSEGEELYESALSGEEAATDENAIITAGMTISGDISTRGSIEIIGSVLGNIEARGKITITGTVQGNSRANEVFADSAKIMGEIRSEGSVKIGQSSVIVGNVVANSAVVAGAVKGDIDVHGPVIIDTSAVVMGNIKSKSVQINNGAVIEGFCSQCYADVDPKTVFNFEEAIKDLKKKKK